jgi:hypothetical protein
MVVALAGCTTGAATPSALLHAESPGQSADASPGPSSTPRPGQPAGAPSSGLISVPDFVVPFAYQLPSGETVELSRTGYPDSPAVIYTRRSVAYAPNAGSRALQVFLVTGLVHPCEAEATRNPSGWTTSPSTKLKTEPMAFMEGLRDIAGVSIGPITATTLGNLPAVTADLGPPGSCPETLMHENGLGLGWRNDEPALKYPSRLTVAKAGGRTIGVLITASTETDLAAWLPIAQAYVDSFVFDDAEG